MAGRREVPLDPGAGPVQRFAFELRKLRVQAGGITYRVMAQQVDYSVTTLSQAAAGEQLPTLPVVLAYVRACGGDRREWEARWRQAAEEVAARADAFEEGVESPYRGLARFETGDSGRFFGREQLTADLVDLLHRCRFAAVFGASGSGKSSLLRAGLIPVLQQPDKGGLRLASIRILTPGDRPAHTHATLLTPTDTPTGAPRDDAGVDRLVIVDQFEEVFTLCHDPAERDRFLTLLLAARRPGSRLRVLIAVRADFYSHCAGQRELAEALRAAHMLVSPMNATELREAIVKPATAAGLTIERALATRLVEEVADAPGGLPLLSHVLLETWRRRRGKTLTMAGYEAAGGLNGAIAKTAEDIYTHLTPHQAHLARTILLRLITPGDGVPDTQRPVPRSELDTLPDPEQTTVVLERLAHARLVTLDNALITLAHEALITGWPRLHSWVDETRERLRQHRALTDHARAWDELDRDPGALYRGTRLAAAREAFTERTHVGLTGLERAFLQASVTLHEKEQQAAARTARRLRSFVAALSMLLVVALVAAGLAYRQRRDALAAQHQALSRQLAAQSVAVPPANSDLAALLAVRAYRTSPTAEATAALYAAAANPLRRTVRVRDQAVVAVSADGRTVATAGGNGALPVYLRDAVTGRIILTVFGPGNILGAAFSPDGRTLCVESFSVVQLWDTRTGRLQGALAFAGLPGSSLPLITFTSQNRALALDSSGGVWDVAAHRLVASAHGFTSTAGQSWISRDGHRLTTVDNGGTVRWWDLTDGHRAPRSVVLHNFDDRLWLGTGVFSPDGRSLAVARGDGTVWEWNLHTGRVLATFASHADGKAVLAFSPDGRVLAVSARDYTIQAWDVGTGRLRATLTGHVGAVTSMAFSADGRTLATLSAMDGTLRMWSVETPTRKSFPVPDGEQVIATALDPYGRMLALAYTDAQSETPTSTVLLCDLANGRTSTVPTRDYVDFLAFSPDGRTLAEQGPWSTTIGLLDVASARMRTSLPGALGSDATFSPDGSTLAVVDSAGETQLWDTTTGHLRAQIVEPSRSVAWMAFSPDGKTLAINDLTTTHLWNLRTRRIDRTLPPEDEPDGIRAWYMSFSPDGRTLATAGDGKVTLWDTTAGRVTVSFDTTVSSITFSPDSHTLATSDDDGAVTLWDRDTGYARATYISDTPVIAMAFSPDGRTLTTQDSNQTVDVWNTGLRGPAATLNRVCQAIGRGLTTQERSLYLPHRASQPDCPQADEQ